MTEGALVTANQTQVLATVTQLNPIYVDVTQSSAELFRLRQALSGGKGQSGEAKAPVTLLITAATTRPMPIRASLSSLKSMSMRRPAPSGCAPPSRTPTTNCCRACSSAPGSIGVRCRMSSWCPSRR